jgi:hypothetical protein
VADLNRSFEQQHLQNLAAQQKQVQELYYATIDEIFRAATGITITPPTFRITDYPALNSAITRILQAFQQQLYITLVNGLQAEWNLSQAKNLALMEQAYGTIAEPVRRSLQTPQQQAFTEYLARKTGRKRLTLSERVWNLTHQLQAEIEQTLFVGLSEGQSAATMARQAKQYLKEPDRLFRRVRNAKGKLVLSQPAKLYKPGPGIYRSSYKNALRLTAHETNTAYRTADHENWKNTKFVLGVEVKLSRSHPAYDMCDRLVGIYPATYKHTGFHVRCLCYSVPLLPTKEEYSQYEDALLRGEGDKFKFSAKVQDIHPKAKQWILDNQEKIEGWANPPLFLQDNPRLMKQVLHD